MEFIDAQIHPMLGGGLMGAEFFQGLEPDEIAVKSADLTTACLDAVGVQRAVIDWRDLGLLKVAIDRYPHRYVTVPTPVSLTLDGKFDLEIAHQNTPADYIRRIAETPWMVGVRLGISYGPMIDFYRCGGMDPYLTAADELGVPVYITLFGHATEFEQTITAHPAVQFIVDHAGLPTPPNMAKPGAQNFAELDTVLALSRFDNVALKLTGFPALSAEPYPFSDVLDPMRALVDAFGAERVMWGSDFTRTFSLHSYRAAVDFLELNDRLSQQEKELMASGTFLRLFGWPQA